MYRILIVDDEKIERKGIRFLLEQIPEKFEIAEAVNGKEALLWLKNHEADILMTDVKMPFMNGIELLEQASVFCPKMKTIIFSGYGEFEYARQAMRFGVAAYILKPVDPDEFQTVMKKVLQSLDGWRQEESRQEMGTAFFKEYVLNALLNGASVEELEEKAAGCYSMDFLDRYKRMMLSELSADYFAGMDDALMEKIREKSGTEFDYLNINPQQSVFFFLNDCGDWKDKAAIINDILQNACGRNIKCYTAVSSGIRDKSQIGLRYQELEILMENRFYDLDSRIFMAENEVENTDDVRLDDDTLIRQMKQDIRAKDVISLREHCDRLFRNYSKNIGFSQVYVKFIFANLLKILYEAIPEKTEKELNSEMERLYRTAEISGIREIIEDNIGILEKNVQKDPKTMHREVETVKRYIYSHYGEELSIEKLAEQVYMAPSYLSTVFKKETGQNLSKFIKACRMEKAREMLENTHEKIVRISEEAGYPNVSYFCQSFREYFGVSPQKYRDKGENSEDENTAMD